MHRGILALAALLSANACAAADALAVRYTEGLLHGFVVVRTLDGNAIGEGELGQSARGDRVTSRLSLRFHDGSTYEDTVVFSQRGRFRLLSEHQVEKGRAFPQARDVLIDAAKGRVVARFLDDHGQQKSVDERLDMPVDIANGIAASILKNAPENALPVTLPVVVPTPKPQLAKVTLARDGDEEFAIGGSRRKAQRYVATVKLQGLAAVVAPLKGKEPHPYHVWILGGPTPSLLRTEGALFAGGPVLRIELASPRWP